MDGKYEAAGVCKTDIRRVGRGRRCRVDVQSKRAVAPDPERCGRISFPQRSTVYPLSAISNKTKKMLATRRCRRQSGIDGAFPGYAASRPRLFSARIGPRPNPRRRPSSAPRLRLLSCRSPGPASLRRRVAPLAMTALLTTPQQQPPPPTTPPPPSTPPPDPTSLPGVPGACSGHDASTNHSRIPTTTPSAFCGAHQSVPPRPPPPTPPTHTTPHFVLPVPLWPAAALEIFFAHRLSVPTTDLTSAEHKTAHYSLICYSINPTRGWVPYFPLPPAFLSRLPPASAARWRGCGPPTLVTHSHRTPHTHLLIGGLPGVRLALPRGRSNAAECQKPIS